MKTKINALHLNPIVIGMTIFMATFAFGCKKETATSALPKSGDLTQVSNGGDGRFDELGFGYDVTGEYASLSATRLKVIDIEKVYLAEPDRVNPIVGTSDYTEYASGENAEQFSYKLAGKYSISGGTPLVSLFVGTMSVAFHQSGSFSAKYSYANASKIIKQKQLVLNVTNESIMNNYLSEAFKSDAQTLSPQDLVARYGTHVLSNIILGAKLELYYRSQTTSSNKANGVNAGFSTKVLKGIFGLETTGSYADSTINSNTNQSLYYRTIGGDGTKGLIGDVKLDNSPLTLTIGAWQSTCTLSNATLIQIDPNGFIPLYNLIQDPTKSAAVKSYIDQYLLDHKVSNLGDVPVYSYYNAGVTDHYLSTANQATSAPGFPNEGIDFYAFKTQVAGTVPIYSYYNLRANDHYFSTVNQPSIAGGSYLREGISFYAYNSAVANSQAIYAYNNSAVNDHYFTPVNQPSISGGSFLNEGIAFYGTN